MSVILTTVSVAVALLACMAVCLIALPVLLILFEVVRDKIWKDKGKDDNK